MNTYLIYYEVSRLNPFTFQVLKRFRRRYQCVVQADSKVEAIKIFHSTIVRSLTHKGGFLKSCEVFEQDEHCLV